MTFGLRSDFGIGGVVRAWTQASALLVVVVASRFLDSEQFGVFAIATVFITVSTTLIYSGVYEYIIQIDDVRSAADTCFWINLSIAICGAAIMTALAPLLAVATRAPELESVMLLLAPSLLVAALTSWQEALILRHKKVRAYYTIWFLSESASAVLAVGLFLAGFRIGALVGYRYSQSILICVCYTIYLRTFPRFTFVAAQARMTLTFASRLYGSRLVGIVGNYSADVIIGILASPAQAGIYRLANRMIFGVGEMFFQPAKTIGWVRFSSAVRNKTGLDRDWLLLMTVLSLVAWPALGGVAVLSHQLTAAVLGGAWSAAAPIVSILAFAKSAQVFEVFLDPMLVLSGRSGKLLRIRMIACVVAVSGFVALASFGAAWIAWVQVVVYASLAVVTVTFGITVTRLGFCTIVTALLPGIATTLATMCAAIAAAAFVETSVWGPFATFAFDAGIVAVVWMFMVGVFFRRKMLAVIGQVKRAEVSSPSAVHQADAS